jgi:plastocyanin
MSRVSRTVVRGCAVVLVAAALPGAASAMPGMGGMDGGGMPAPSIAIGYAAFAIPRLDVLAGDTVQWMNDSVRVHDVVARDASFDSGRLPGGDHFAHQFTQPGTVEYYCSLHPFMTGEIDVHPLLLDAPAGLAGSGKPFVLSGRAGAGITGSVTIEGDAGSGFAPVGTAAVAPDGTFRASVVPAATTTYRAVSSDGESPAVQLTVLDHTVAVSAQHRGRSTALVVRVAPADPGALVVLQLRLRDRFGWWPVKKARLDGSSTARFVVRRRAGVPGRVLLTLPDGATEIARSPTVRVGPLRR